MERNELEEDTTTSVENEPVDLISKPEQNFNSSIDENIISLQWVV